MMLPLTRGMMIAKIATELVHEVAATAVVGTSNSVDLPGMESVNGRTVIDYGLQALKNSASSDQQGRSIDLDGSDVTSLVPGRKHSSYFLFKKAIRIS
jgi:hypothetical protein